MKTIWAYALGKTIQGVCKTEGEAKEEASKLDPVVFSGSTLHPNTFEIAVKDLRPGFQYTMWYCSTQLKKPEWLNFSHIEIN